MSYPNKYMIPEDRIPKPWRQGPYECCVAAAIAKILEVINYVKTGTYTMMSKGYVYAMHNPPEKSQGGSYTEYAVEKLLEYGSVPEEMFPEMDEPPYILHKLNDGDDELYLQMLIQNDYIHHQNLIDLQCPSLQIIVQYDKL